MLGKNPRSGVREYGTGSRIEHPRIHREGRVAGVRHEHLVARRQRELHRQMQGLRRADRHPDLLDLGGDPVLDRELLDDRASKRQDAAIRVVVGVVAVPRGLGGGCDVGRDRHVGLAHPERDHAVEFCGDLIDPADARAGHRGDVSGERRHASG